ncbi:MAG: response regulator [Bacteroidales bacterium]|nr:response regulator [Bacteroidales bacterium]
MKTDKASENQFAIHGVNWNDKKMVVIEDNQTCATLIQEIFEETRIQIFTALTGQNGIKLLKQNQDTDVVLLDIRLPDMDGFMVFDEIQKIKPYLPVIAITAWASAEMGYRCRKSGFYGFLLKPFDIASLLRMVNFALENKTN